MRARWLFVALAIGSALPSAIQAGSPLHAPGKSGRPCAHCPKGHATARGFGIPIPLVGLGHTAPGGHPQDFVNCQAAGQYNYPVPPLYTYHWPGVSKQVSMTDYHSPWRFVPLKPYVDEPNIGEAGQLRRLRETPWERPEVMERQLPPTNLPLDVYAPNAPAFAEPVNGPIAVEQPTADAPLRNRPEQPADEESAESTEPASDSEALPGEADESPSDQEDKEEVGDDVDESAARSPIIRRPARTARAPRILRAQPQPIR